MVLLLGALWVPEGYYWWRVGRRGAGLLLFFSALLCNVMHTLRQHCFSLFNPSHQPYLSVFSVHVSCGVCNTHMQLHTCHNPHRIRITPASHQWTYCLNYNQTKCTYGCARPLLLPPPFLVCGPDFLFLDLSTALFLPNYLHQNAVSSPLFLSF